MKKIIPFLPIIIFWYYDTCLRNRFRFCKKRNHKNDINFNCYTIYNNFHNT